MLLLNFVIKISRELINSRSEHDLEIYFSCHTSCVSTTEFRYQTFVMHGHKQKLETFVLCCC